MQQTIDFTVLKALIKSAMTFPEYSNKVYIFKDICDGNKSSLQCM